LAFLVHFHDSLVDLTRQLQLGLGIGLRLLQLFDVLENKISRIKSERSRRELVNDEPLVHHVRQYTAPGEP
jgi:hypothetical protein